MEYLTATVQDEAYECFLRLFMKESNDDPNITRAFVARRAGKSPGQITRYMSSPGNWTFGTYATLLATLGYKAVLSAEKIVDMARVNSCHEFFEHPQVTDRSFKIPIERLAVAKNQIDPEIGATPINAQNHL